MLIHIDNFSTKPKYIYIYCYHLLSYNKYLTNSIIVMISERMKYTFLERTRCMMLVTKLPKLLWAKVTIILAR